MRATAFSVMAILLVGSVALAAPPPALAGEARDAREQAPSSPPRMPRVVPPAKRPLGTTSAVTVDPCGPVAGCLEAHQGAAPWASLGPIDVLNRNTKAHGKVRLYDDHGVLDRGEARAFMRIASSAAASSNEARDEASEGGEDDERLDLRVVQVAIRSAYHFGGATISIVSATRAGARGKHATGEALDFALEGVKASSLAAYLRGTPRAGVGIYTHPKTQYVHLDVREHSYHWIDGSPPGVSWRERLLSDPKQAARDAAWSPLLDLPEGR